MYNFLLLANIIILAKILLRGLLGFRGIVNSTTLLSPEFGAVSVRIQSGKKKKRNLLADTNRNNFIEQISYRADGRNEKSRV